MAILPVLILTLVATPLNIRSVLETKTIYSPLVQSVERWTVNPYVASSSLAGGANLTVFVQ